MPVFFPAVQRRSANCFFGSRTVIFVSTDRHTDMHPIWTPVFGSENRPKGLDNLKIPTIIPTAGARMVPFTNWTQLGCWSPNHLKIVDRIKAAGYSRYQQTVLDKVRNNINPLRTVIYSKGKIASEFRITNQSARVVGRNVV